MLFVVVLVNLFANCLQIMKPTLLLILDNRAQKKSGTYPVKLRIIYKRKVKYYPTGYDMTEEEWTFLNGPEKLKREQKEIKETIIGIQGKAKSVIEGMKFFTFPEFEKQFYNDRTSEGSLSDTYKEYIERLKAEERVGTAQSYESSINSLKEFRTKVDFDQINPEFLTAYERWMTDKGKSSTTVGIYLRSLRTIFNEAIAAGRVPKELYPFGKRRYEIPAGRNIKKALTLEDVNRIYQYKCVPESNMQKAKDFWMLCYLGNGINVKDILHLKFKNLKGEYIEFVRAKTKRSTKTNQKPISIYMLPEVRQIIERWADADPQPDNFIFPVLNKSMTAEKQHAVVKQFTKMVNKYVQMIADALEMDKHITTYTARHTFSTVLKRSGASTEFISEALGHANKRTTESYLDSFEKDTQKEFAEKLMAF